jgi:F-type H+-transporting ATPase subunit gamma
MAANLQLLRRRIKTSQNIAQIARAMEMISASKIKKAQYAVENNKPYAEKVTDLTTTLIKHVDMSKFGHPYLNSVDSSKQLLIVMSPDKGLCGSLNTNLFKKLIEIDNKDTKIVALGKKAHQFSQKLESDVLAGFNLGTTLPDYSTVFKLIEIINEEFNSRRISSVKVLFTSFRSIFAQEPILKTILPIQVSHDEANLPYIFEPKAEEILSELLPYYVEVMLYSMILESFTSEQASRMLAMQNAKNNALDIADYLTLAYNKSRQERITNELLSLSNNS